MRKDFSINGLPRVRFETVTSIVDEVFTKNTDFGLSDFLSTMENSNPDLAVVVYSFIDSIADALAKYNEEQQDEICAVAKMAAHLVYKSLEKQLEINHME